MATGQAMKTRTRSSIAALRRPNPNVRLAVSESNMLREGVAYLEGGRNDGLQKA